VCVCGTRTARLQGCAVAGGAACFVENPGGYVDEVAAPSACSNLRAEQEENHPKMFVEPRHIGATSWNKASARGIDEGGGQKDRVNFGGSALTAVCADEPSINAEMKIPAKSKQADALGMIPQIQCSSQGNREHKLTQKPCK
jgi:hypothetical protein